MAGGTLALFAILGTTVAASAQRNDDRYKDNRKRQEKMQKELAKAEKKREAEWNRRNTQFRTRTIGSGYYTVEPNARITEGRYRVNRNGTWYNTDNRGADLLRQAVNEGYRQGFEAGRADRSTRRRGGWTNSIGYRNGTYGYQNGVDRNQYQYYFRQGFQRGYQDGSNSRYQDGYYGDYQYGRNDGGSLNILGSILNQILNIQSY